MKDIETKEEIREIITKFYSLLLSDKRISPHFEPLVPNLDEHLDQVTQFWADLLFNTWEYKKNMFKIHEEHHHAMHIEPEHFEIWKNYLISEIESNYKGEKSTKFIQHIESMITMMKIKMK